MKKILILIFILASFQGFGQGVRTKPVYITLFDHEYSPYPILPNIWPKSYSGYGMPAEDRTNDYFTIKYE